MYNLFFNFKAELIHVNFFKIKFYLYYNMFFIINIKILMHLSFSNTFRDARCNLNIFDEPTL